MLRLEDLTTKSKGRWRRQSNRFLASWPWTNLDEMRFAVCGPAISRRCRMDNNSCCTKTIQVPYMPWIKDGASGNAGSLTVSMMRTWYGDGKMFCAFMAETRQRTASSLEQRDF